MDVSKIQLSVAEKELMQNAEIILTKNRILEKIKQLLEELQERQMNFAGTYLRQHEAFITSPKISKGENYLGLPYLILDYPRMSSGSNLFFIRNMFWWGKFFSSTLHLSGMYKEMYSEKIREALPTLPAHYIGINTNPWVHQFESDNYKSTQMLSANELSEAIERDHLKIGMMLPLEQWQEAPGKLFKNWKLYLQMAGLITDAV